MNIDLTPIIQAVIALLAAIVTYKLVPWITSRTTETQRATLQMITKTLVFAAEQLYKTGTISDRLEYVKLRLIDCGYTFDLNMIEAAVREINIAQMKPPDPAEKDAIQSTTRRLK